MPRIGQYWVSTELYYTTEHTWARIQENGTVKVGVDDFASKTAGKILFVEMLEIGKEVEYMKPFGEIETSKWIGELYSPLTGRIVALNKEVLEKPQLMNEDPYGAGWLIEIQPVKVNEEIPKLLHGEKAVEWLKKEIEARKKK